MKKFLLGLSMVGFAIAMVCSWFNGNIGYSIGVTIAMLLFMWLTLSFIKRYRTVRLAVIVIITGVAIFFASMNVSLLAYRKNNPNVEKSDGAVKVTTLQEKEDCEEKKEETDKAALEEETEKEEADEEETEDFTSVEETESKPSVGKKKEDKEPVVVEKIVEKRVEVPVEKVVEKIEYVEVPVVEYVEVTAPTIEPEDVTPITPPALPQYGYSGDPTNNYGYGYAGDPTMGNYGYGYGSNYGDPTINNNYYYDNNYTSSVTISGDKKVSLGETVCYTISGVSSISESKLKLPYGVSLEKIRGSKVYLTFDEVGSFYIKYGSANINIKVQADD